MKFPWVSKTFVLENRKEKNLKSNSNSKATQKGPNSSYFSSTATTSSLVSSFKVQTPIQFSIVLFLFLFVYIELPSLWLSESLSLSLSLLVRWFHIFHIEDWRSMFDSYQQLEAGPSYQESLKVLEADIQHANVLWVLCLCLCVCVYFWFFTFNVVIGACLKFEF